MTEEFFVLLEPGQAFTRRLAIGEWLTRDAAERGAIRHEDRESIGAAIEADRSHAFRRILLEGIVRDLPRKLGSKNVGFLSTDFRCENISNVWRPW